MSPYALPERVRSPTTSHLPPEGRECGDVRRGPYVHADHHQVVRVEEVEGDWLSQVERQPDGAEGDAGVGGGEDDPPGGAHLGRVRRQDHLGGRGQGQSVERRYGGGVRVADGDEEF